MSDAIKLPIKVGEKFLSGGVEVEIICVTGKSLCCPIIDNYGDCYTAAGECYEDIEEDLDLKPLPELEIVIPEGVDFYITSEAMQNKCLELQESGRRFTCDGDEKKMMFDTGWAIYRLLPVVITEGVEFSGEQYRSEFERQAKEGREFELWNSEDWFPSRPEFFNDIKYRLVPQHRDAVGNTLKIGDRVEAGDSRFTIARFNGTRVEFKESGWDACKHCRLLKTVKRPLCEDDLDKAPCPRLRSNGHVMSPDWSDRGVNVGVLSLKWTELGEWQWRPSADKPWGPCEVEEGVLA